MSEYERGRRDINDLCEAISRIRWARGTSKLDEAIFEAVKIQSIIDSSRPLAATSGTPAPSDPDWCDVCKASQMVVENGEHVCGLSAYEAYSLGWRRGNNTTPPPADETLPAGARSAYAAFDAAVKFMQANGYSDWDGTADGSEITRTGCANMMARYLAAARRGS